MPKTIVIDPVTRIEGHLKIEAVVDGGVVKEARSSGTLFRGFEIFLQDRDPRDAARMTQRVCGVCPTGHASASALALDDAFAVSDKVPPNGRVMRDLILGSNFIQSHVLHFYALAALDYVDVAAVDGGGPDEPELRKVKEFLSRGALGPFVPRYEGVYRLAKEANRAAVLHYAKALHIRRLAHEMGAVFGGRMPLQVATVVGGVLSTPDDAKIAAFLAKLDEIRDFIDNCYLPDVLAVAGAYGDHLEMGLGVGNYVGYGAFLYDEKLEPQFLTRGVLTGGSLSELDAARISEDVKNSWFDDSCAAHPSEGKTEPVPDKKDAYSWLKSPRYDGVAHEVGPLARMLVGYHNGTKHIKEAVDGLCSAAGIKAEQVGGVLGRHAARALETKLVADAMREWVLKLKPGEPVCAEAPVPKEGSGMGLTEAPRGALGHWVQVKDRKIERYQLVVPTTWNASPRDAQDNPGPIEKALEGVKVVDEENPVELVRVVRSFDPCLACAVHMVRLGRKGPRPVRVLRVS